MKPTSILLILFLIPVLPVVADATPPNLVVPITENVGARMATLVLQSSATGTGYFTLLKGSGVDCGSGAQVAAGLDSSGVMAPYHGSLPLVADTSGSYTVRNLTQSTAYTICFTANTPGNQNLNPVPSTANLTSTAVKTFVNPVWEPLGTAGFSSGPAGYTSLTFAPDGAPTVAFIDQDSGSMPTVMQFRNGAWYTLGSNGFNSGQAEYTSLAFAPDGTPAVAFRNWGIGINGKAVVMKFNGTSWGTVGNAGFSAGDAGFITLAYAPDGTPHVAYGDWGNGRNGKATVMKFNGTSWVPLGNAGFSAGESMYHSLAFAPDGTVTVAYRDWGNEARATVMQYRNGTWETLGSVGFSAGGVMFNSLTFALDGTPFVAFMDEANDSKATVMQYRNGAWSAVGIAGFSAGFAYSTSLAFAPDGTPFVAYQDYGNGARATVMQYRGGSWTAVGSAGFSSGGAGGTSLAFAPDGTPFVAYRDNGRDGKATVMKLVSGAANKGDVNIDGVINVFDALLTLQYSVGLYKPTDEPTFKTIADVAPLDAGKPKGNGTVDVFDALAILRHSVGLDPW